MITLKIRIPDEEKAASSRRALEEGTSESALVRRMIQERVFTTAASLLADIEALVGDTRLAIKKRA